MAVHDQLTLEKMRESLNKNPNSEWPLIIDNQVQVLQRFGNLSVHHKPEKINASEVWESIYPSLINLPIGCSQKRWDYFKNLI